jgi:hypothetical protein
MQLPSKWLRAVTITLLGSAMALTLAWYRLSQPLWSSVSPADHVPTVSAATLERHVRVLSTDYANRSIDKPARLNGAARYIETELTALGLTVQRQTYKDQDSTFYNLITPLGPDTPEVIVIGAHYDVAGPQPGADDNASGVAGLIELARLLKDAPLKQRVELVAYSTEEPPYFRTQGMGSAVHAKSLKAAGKLVRWMLSLECIGYFSDAPGSQEHPVSLLNAIYPTVGNFIALVGYMGDGAVARRLKIAMKSANQLPVHSISAPGFIVGIDFSDHLNYAHEGYAAMMVTDTAFYRNKAYHTPQDTPERLDYQRMAQVVQGVHQAVWVEAVTP